MTDNENNGESEVPSSWGMDTPSAAPTPPPPAPPSPTSQPTTPASAPFGQQVPPPPHAVPHVPQQQTPPPFGATFGGVPQMPPGTGASAGTPVLSGDYGITQPPLAPDAPTKSSKLPWIAAMFGALVLLGGGGFFALTAFGASGGAETPEEAVDAMFAALGNEDFITIGELLEPSERRTIVEPTITEVLPELIRLGLLDDSVDAGDVGGIDFEFSDLTYRVEALAQNPDIVHVYLTGGEVATEFNSAEFPFSDRFREQFGDELEDEERQVEQIEETETPLTFVQRDGRWYFSIWFSAAEAARLEVGERLPRASEAPAALGSETPEAAIEAMFAEMVEMDLDGLIGRMDPDEMAVLYRYSPLFLDDGQSVLDELADEMREQNVSWDIRDFEFDVEADGDDANVTVRAFTIEVQSPDADVRFTYGRQQLSGTVLADEFGGRGSFETTTTKLTFEGVIDGEPFSGEITVDPDAYRISGSGEAGGETAEGEVTIDPDGVCSRYNMTVSGETESGCIEDDLDDEDEVFFEFYQGVFENWPEEFPGFEMSARRTDGEWYVSPIGTAFDGYMAVLRGIDEEQFDDLLDSAEQLDSFEALDALDDVMDEALGSDASTSEDFEDLFADLDIDTGDDIDTSPDVNFGRDPDVESNMALTVDRGATVELIDSVSIGTFDAATLDLEAGDTVTITVQTDGISDLDTTLTVLFQDTNAVVGFNDDADAGAGLTGLFDSQLIVEVTDTGTYVIEIASYDYGSAGDYTLTVQRS